MAVVTGLRACDIAALKFENIDWVNGEIKHGRSGAVVPTGLPRFARNDGGA